MYLRILQEFRYVWNWHLSSDIRNPILDQEWSCCDHQPVRRDGRQSCSTEGMLRSKGIRTLAIVNVVGSSIAREADNVFYTLAGPEIAVATTKAYSTQLIAAYVLAIQFAKVKGQIDEEQYTGLISKNSRLFRTRSRSIIDDKERLQWFASKQANCQRCISLSEEELIMPSVWKAA